MTDLQILFLPLAAFGAHLGLHFGSYKVTGGRIGLLNSLAAGFIGGWLTVAAIVYGHPPEDAFYRFVEGGLCFSFAWYCFFHFVNIGEASLRIRVLDEIREKGRGMTVGELSNVYSPVTIVDTRLARLLNSGELKESGGKYSIQKPKLLLAAKLIHLFRLLIHGRRKALELTGQGEDRRTVVLGASGFIGRHLMAVVSQGVPVTSRNVDLASFVAQAQLCSLLRRTDNLVILSALTPEHGKDEEIRERNIAMIRNVIGALRVQPVRHVTLVSSDAVYDSAASPFDDKTPVAPSDNYGKAHAERERLLQPVCAELKIPLAIFRPCAVYGPGDTHDSYGPNRFAKSAVRDGKIRLLGQGEERRDYVYVDDLCRALAAAGSRTVEGTFNVATGNAVRFLDLARAIQERAGRAVEIEFAGRNQPPVDRIHRPEAFARAFPEVSFRSLDAGLDELLESLKS